MENGKPKTKKRKYSRNGCKECKRRKQKCDEGKPACHQCTRLHKVCIYDLERPIRFENLGYILAVQETEHNRGNRNDTGSKLTGQTPTKMSSKHVSSVPIPNLLTPLLLPEMDFNESIGSLDLQVAKDLLDDANSLVTNIHDLATHELTLDDIIIPEIADMPHLSPESLAPEAILGTVNNRKLANEVIEKYDLQDADKELLTSVCLGPKSYLIFPFASSVESNQVMTVLLQHLKSCPYLLYSLLAISATFQFNLGNEHCDVISRTHISTCLKLLSAAFSPELSENVNKSIWNDIEGLLLTVLVLTTNFAASYKVNKVGILHSWRTHLRGAKDLLLNYILNYKRRNISPGLALAKLWYFAIEMTAGLNSPLGGTLSKVRKLDKPQIKSENRETVEQAQEDELLFLDTGFFDEHSNPEYYRILVQSQLVTTGAHPFNLFLGYTIEYVRAAEELVRGIIFLREHPNNRLSTNQIAKITSLIYQSLQATVIPGVNLKTFEVLDTVQVDIPASLAISEGKRVSWFDLAQQVHTNHLYLKMLITPGMMNLPKTHHLVRELVSTLIESLVMVKKRSSDGSFYLDRNIFDSRAMMIQSPIVQCIELIDNLDDLEKASLYFHGLVELGTGSAAAACERVRKHRINLQQLKFEDISYHDPEVETLPFS